MYTQDDIRQIAIQIERNGEKAYRAAGDRVADPRLTKILHWLAEEEHQHAKWFESLPTSAGEANEAYREMEAMGRSLLKEMVEDKTFSLDTGQLVAAGDMLSILTQSVLFEEDTILFYDMLKAFIEEEEGMAQLELVIEQERGHIKVLEKLKAKLDQGDEPDFSGVLPSVE